MESVDVPRPIFVPADAGVSPFAGETITALAPMVAIYFEPRVGPHWRGYLRAGSTARVIAGPLSDEGCPPRADRAHTGWYQVEGDGYVCVSRGAVLTRDLTRDACARLPNAPMLDASMPYRYGLAPHAGVVYRALPTAADEALAEPARFGDGGAAPLGPLRIATLESLEGTPGTPVLRRLLRGMYVAVERATRSTSGNVYWRTHGGGYVRTDALMMVGPQPLHGVALAGEVRLPLAFVSADNVALRRLGADGVMYRTGRVARMTAFALASTTRVTWRDEDYLRTRDDRYVRDADVTVVTAVDPPAEIGPRERWIEVDLDRQSLVAWEGATPVYATLVSTGLRNVDNPAANYETVQGAFRIEHKHLSTTMDGNTGTGPYSIEEVPWAMYFEGSFALHGAYWHAGFGQPRSHGCVNLAPDDARWLFRFTTPTIPAGWHAAFATERDPGTRIYVHYTPQPLGERGGPAVIPGH